MLRMQAIPKSGGPLLRNWFITHDLWLSLLIVLLMGLGLVMVASSSIAIADRRFDDPLHYFWAQSIAIALGLGAVTICLHIPLRVWQVLGVPLITVGILLLLLLLVPGLGKEINGSIRWFVIGSNLVQVSEFIKFFVIVYLAGYMVRHSQDVRNNFRGFIRPILLLTVIAVLLLLQPDYGSCVVLFATALGMLFMGGIPITRFVIWLLTAIVVLTSLIMLSPYRMRRLMSFSDPWQDPFSSGFQLTQSLIAFGRGDWFGVGLGGSIQKLFYLPEAHTDFIFSVFAEEFGLFGSISLILLFAFLIWRIFLIGQIAAKLDKLFAAYLAYGIGLIIGLQAFINMGVNLGVLPTKGLPLPLMSYGSNSMIVTCLLLGLLLRVETENQQLNRSSGKVICYAQ